MGGFRKVVPDRPGAEGLGLRLRLAKRRLANEPKIGSGGQPGTDSGGTIVTAQCGCCRKNHGTKDSSEGGTALERTNRGAVAPTRATASASYRGKKEGKEKRDAKRRNKRSLKFVIPLLFC